MGTNTDNMLLSMSSKKGLIVFFIPPQKIVNGGILSIFSICKVSRQFENIHKSRVVLATYPGQKSYKHNDLFDNNETIYSFDEIVSMGIPDSLLLHVPEYASSEVFMGLKKYRVYIDKIPKLSVNIMNQNVLMMPSPIDAANWFSLTDDVTQTTAHDKYTTQQLADKYFLPTHHFSTFVDPGQYSWRDFDKKEELIALSPDYVKERSAIIEKLKARLPNYKLVTIQNMKYEDFKELISRARFCITFGEGFDGYYVEAFLSGSITLAVYNDDFFPDKDFDGFENTYSSYPEMLLKIDKDIERLNSRLIYKKTVDLNFKKIASLYSFDNYTNNIKNFYLGRFKYVPNNNSAKRLIADMVKERDKLLEEKETIITGQQKLLEEKETAIRTVSKAVEERDRVIDGMVNSRSWKLTKPLRKAGSTVRKRPR